MGADLWRRDRNPRVGIDEPRRAALLALEAGEVWFDEPLAGFTALGLGGPAEALVRPGDADGWGRLLDWCRQEKLPVTTIGHGFGLVVREGGVPGVTVVTTGMARTATPEQPGWGDAAWAALAEAVGSQGAGAPTLTFVQAGARAAPLEGVGGVDTAAGGHGTLGGLLRRAGGDLRDRIAAVALVGDRGHIQGRAGDRIDVSGNRVQIPRRAGIAAVAWRGAARITTTPEDRGRGAARGKMRLFRDPEGTTASRVLEALDLKGIRLREVVIDAEDPNQIENKGEGTATEVVALARYLKERAARDAGVRLEECYRVVGKK